MAKKVLVVEDDSNIAELLRLYLEKDGFDVFLAADGGEGIRRAQELQPDLILLDIMLPVVDGWVVCSEVRKTSNVPIIMLTAKGEERDVVAGLDAGANDYVTKPFSKAILLARIRAFLRTSGQEAGPLALDGLVFDEAAHAVALNGAPLDLTLSEYRILELLVRNVHRVFTRAHIIDRISDGQKCVTDRTVDVLLVGLRRKLGAWAAHVKTIRGVGYRAE